MIESFVVHNRSARARLAHTTVWHRVVVIEVSLSQPRRSQQEVGVATELG